MQISFSLNPRAVKALNKAGFKSIGDILAARPNDRRLYARTFGRTLKLYITDLKVSIEHAVSEHNFTSDIDSVIDAYLALAKPQAAQAIKQSYGFKGEPLPYREIAEQLNKKVTRQFVHLMINTAFKNMRRAPIFTGDQKRFLNRLVLFLDGNDGVADIWDMVYRISWKSKSYNEPAALMFLIDLFTDPNNKVVVPVKSPLLKEQKIYGSVRYPLDQIPTIQKILKQRLTEEGGIDKPVLINKLLKGTALEQHPDDHGGLGFIKKAFSFTQRVMRVGDAFRFYKGKGQN